MPILDRSAYSPIPQPLPGEIWELNIEEESQASKRHIAIVREPQSDNPLVFSAMLLSTKVGYLSNIDILIPVAISGLDRDILAETWNVGVLPVDLLSRRVGNRLSREIYDLLLSIGDVNRGISVDLPSMTSILKKRGSANEKLGLRTVDRANSSSQAINNFHQQENLWLQSLNPIAIANTEKLVRQAIEIEREFITFSQVRTCLSQWFQDIIEPEWQSLKSIDRRLAIPTRSLTLDDEITEIIALLKSTDTQILRQSIEHLGKIAEGNERAIQSLAAIVNTTPSDETLWLAVASLRQIAPEHPNLGISQSKSIDLGTTIDFVVNIIPKATDRVGILFQVYSAHSQTYLPANLKLILQDEIGNNLKEITARSNNTSIQLKISGIANEVFSICLELDGIQSIVDFVI